MQPSFLYLSFVSHTHFLHLCCNEMSVAVTQLKQEIVGASVSACVFPFPFVVCNITVVHFLEEEHNFDQQLTGYMKI